MLAKINSIGARIVPIRGTLTAVTAASCDNSRSVFLVLALALLLSGCTPAGPRALLKGKRLLDRGDAAAAVTEFKRATTLLTTNAGAWNYLGVALQRAGQPDEAASAYQTALKLDRDLVEAHFNLGCLALEQNKPDTAKAEFTACTLRRPNDAAGWLKLASAQMKFGDTIAAERSFSTVLALKTNDAEAFNGLGLARIQRGKPRDAAQFFYAAIQSRLDFAPALLNLAVVNQQYLHDNKAALESYHAYLALTPRPANYDDVKACAATLEQSDIATTVMTPAVVRPSTPTPEIKPHPANVVTQHLAAASHTETENAQRVPPRLTNTVSAAPQNPAPTVSSVPTQTVQVRPETPIIAAPPTNYSTPAQAHPLPNTTVTSTQPSIAPNVAPNDDLEAPMPEEQPRRGFFHRLFGYRGNKNPAPANPPPSNLTPIPEPTDTMAGTKAAPQQPAETKPVTPTAPKFPHYAYTLPHAPAPGDRHAAEGPFTKARLAEQDEKWADALQWYQTAADTDPAWFEAQYNAGVIAHRLQNYPSALPRYELALALQPESVDARYNFALALKSAGHVLDAADELRKILAASPDEVRAHLALANLCARPIQDTTQAREHYKAVLKLQPDIPQANDIRGWLLANPK